VRAAHIKLVDNQKLVSGELSLQPKQPLLIASLQTVMDESRGGVEAKPTSPFWQAARPSPRPMWCFAGAAVAGPYDVLPAGHILRAGELQNEGLVERRNGGESKLSRLFTAGTAPP